MQEEQNGNFIIITCPECENKYRVNADLLEKPRTVKCISCNHSWLYTPEFSIPLVAEEDADSRGDFDYGETLDEHQTLINDDLKYKLKDNDLSQKEDDFERLFKELEQHANTAIVKKESKENSKQIEPIEAKKEEEKDNFEDLFAQLDKIQEEAQQNAIKIEKERLKAEELANLEKEKQAMQLQAQAKEENFEDNLGDTYEDTQDEKEEELDDYADDDELEEDDELDDELEEDTADKPKEDWNKESDEEEESYEDDSENTEEPSKPKQENKEGKNLNDTEKQNKYVKYTVFAITAILILCSIFTTSIVFYNELPAFLQAGLSITGIKKIQDLQITEVIPKVIASGNASYNLILNITIANLGHDERKIPDLVVTFTDNNAKKHEYLIKVLDKKLNSYQYQKIEYKALALEFIPKSISVSMLDGINKWISYYR